jgi:hypothetical protein
MTDLELLRWLADHGHDLADFAQRHLPPPQVVIDVTDGDSLHAVLASAPSGAIVRPQGAFTGSFTVPDGVTLEGGTLIATANAPALIPGSRTSIRGVTITADSHVSELVRYEQVSDVLMEDCTISGHPALGAKRGIRLNAANVIIRRTTIRDCKAIGADSQAICGWAYTKNVLIQDCHVEAAGENIMFGGADAPSAEAIPRDITIERCTLRKPLEWRGSSWVVKNLFELKAAINVTLRACVLEHLWQAGQVGYAILLKSVNQDGTAPFSEVRDVLIEHNIIRHVSGGFNLHYGPQGPCVPMTHVTIRDNELDISKALYAGTGYFALITGVDDLTLEHNRVQTDGPITLYFAGRACQRLQITGNILPDLAYGIKGDGTAEGLPTLTTYAPGHVFEGNLIVTHSPQVYGTANRCDATLPADTTGYGPRPIG